MIAPVLDEIAAENAGKVRIAKVNVDENPGLARQFDVMSIPTLLVFKDGKADCKLIGAKGKAQLLEDLADYL
jgi:thioredoxin 1